MAIGIITGREIKKNRDGTNDRIILQVELEADDVKSVELMSESGDDNNPATGCRVYITDADTDGSYKIATAVTDDLAPEVDPGEREIYSTDNPVTSKLARIKLDKTGNIILNNDTDFAVSWTDLNTALQLLVTAINATFATKADAAGAAGALTLDLSLAKVLTVKLP